MRQASRHDRHVFGAAPGVGSFTIIFLAYLFLIAAPNAWLVPTVALLTAALIASSISRWFHDHVVPRARRADPKSRLHI